MYKGFNLKVEDDYFSAWSGHGLRLHERNKASVESTLDKYFDDDGVISAAKVTQSWFPSISADVFISHSHADSDAAVGLAGWLDEKFGLKAFIDSTVWGYSENLLKKFDNKYCWNKESKTYNYDKRNKTTSHVNIMLSAALHNMIDTAECVIFLNSPNSVTCKGYVTNEATHSPWIFSEISMTQLIEPRLRRKTTLLRKAMESNEVHAQDMAIKYDISLNHLTEIDGGDLDQWRRSVRLSSTRGPETLDTLYDLHGLI